MKIAKIQTSGKEGAEKAAISAAKKLGVAITGWKPKKSDATEKELRETASTKVEQSIIWNVRDSHATLIFEPDKSASAALAYEVAEAYARPFMISYDYHEIKHWLDTLGEELTLNVVGPTEEECPGISKKVKTVLSKLFAAYDSFILEA